jgi:hypothetical protein
MFRVPNFNLECAIWRNQGNDELYAEPDVTSKCNLSPGKRGMVIQAQAPITGFPPMLMELLLPAGTDIRAYWNAILPDIVEVPKDTHRFYLVMQVDDVAKGFANEYRLAWISYSVLGGQNFSLPAPVPLP